MLELQNVLRRFVDYVKLPKLPAKIRQEMHLDWQVRAPEVAFEDYVQARCPADFRPFEGSPMVDQVLLEALQRRMEQLERRLQRGWSLFLPRGVEAKVNQSKILKPKVPEELWLKWNEVYELLGDPISKEQLLKSRLVAPSAVEHVMSTLTTESTCCRRALLKETEGF